MNLQVFKNDELGQIRAVELNGEGWLIGKDVAELLGYERADNAIRNHVDDDDKLMHQISASGQSRNMLIINESGLYSLVMGSKLSGAKQFKRWVTKDVLPSIRKHGMYAVNDLLENPDMLIAAATRLKEERAARLEAEKKVQVLAPKAEFYDDVAGSKDAISISEVAKVLGIKGLGRNNLFQLLRDKKILQTNNQPYQTYVDRGYFRVIEQKFNTPTGDIKINIKTLVYQKGLDYIRKVAKEA